MKHLGSQCTKHDAQTLSPRTKCGCRTLLLLAGDPNLPECTFRQKRHPDLGEEVIGMFFLGGRVCLRLGVYVEGDCI